MSALHSALSRASRNTAVKDKPKAHKRSSSEGPSMGRSRYGRTPIHTFSDDEDVSTRICTEVARATMRNPSMDTGVFFSTAGDSRRDINMSDAVIVISAAILNHIGNNRMGSDLLACSATCSKYYTEMSLGIQRVRAMFVTMLFALNPNLITMLERSLIISLKRASTIGSDTYSKSQLMTVIKTLHRDGTIDDSEAGDITINTLGLDGVEASNRLSIQKTPTELIHPDDSATQVIHIPKARQRIKQGDLMSYIRRRKSGPEPEFGEVFPSATRPVRVETNTNRAGLGFRRDSITSSAAVDNINRMMGGLTVKSIDIDSGSVRYRRPRVDDVHDGQSVATRAMEQVPDSEPVVWDFLNSENTRNPPPTETFLPDGVVREQVRYTPPLRSVDSAEYLMGQLA